MMSASATVTDASAGAGAEGIIPPDAAAALASWICPEHLQPERLRAWRAWYRDPSPRPLHLRQFLHPARAEAVGVAIAHLRSWQRVFSLLRDETSIEDVTEQEWLAAPAERRFSRQDLARPLSALVHDGAQDEGERVRLAELLAFAVVGPALRTWLTLLSGQPLSPTMSCEIARYQPGDHIEEHSDTHDDRILAINLYFGPHPGRGGGGRLGFRNQAGQSFAVEPVANSVALFPVRRGCVHWVTPWDRPEPGRHTVSMSVRPRRQAP